MVEANTKITAERYFLYGYMTAYRTCTSGHRPSVFLYMTEQDIALKEKDLTDKAVLICVSELSLAPRCRSLFLRKKIDNRNNLFVSTPKGH